MMRRVTKLRNLSRLTHNLLQVVIPLAVFGLTTISLSGIAFALILLAKWRVLAVKSRYWGINIRSNMVDILFGLSVVEFMSQEDIWGRLIWLGVFIIWTLGLKRLSSTVGMITQATAAQALAVSALIYNNQSLGLLTFAGGIWFIAYFSARHALSANDEDHSSNLAHIWALFAVQLAWVLGHWHIWFWFVPQVTLLLSVLFLGLNSLYALHKNESLSDSVLRQISASVGIIVLAIIVLSDWQDKTI